MRRRELLGVAAAGALVGGETGLRVERVRQGFHNGEHNAFTDLVRFRDRYYLTFRSCPEGHMLFPSSRILVLESENGEEWREVHRFGVAKRDVRDPHFVVFQGKLLVYTGTWYCGDTAPETRDLNEMVGYVSGTADGRNWEAPQVVEGSYGHYIWRGAVWGERVWLCARRKREFVKGLDGRATAPLVEAVLLESADGVRFRMAGLAQEEYGDETAYHFEPDGRLIGVARRSNRNAELLEARAPFREFRRRDLGRYIGGPMLVQWEGRYLVGGRRMTEPKDPAMVLYWLDVEKAGLTEAAVLPSGGDCSYPGFVATGKGRGLLSWYSTHATEKAAIYLAELRLG